MAAFNADNPPPSRHALAHFWGGISAACISAGVLSALLFSQPPEYPGATAAVFLGLAAIGPAIAFFYCRKPLPLEHEGIELPLKDGTKVSLVCEWFPHMDKDRQTYIRRSFHGRLAERMVHEPLDTVEPDKVRQWVEQAIAGFVVEQKFSVFRLRLTSIADPPRSGPPGGIVIGDYDR